MIMSTPHLAEDVVIDIKRLTCVEPGLPSDFKKKTFGKAPKPDFCVCFKDGGRYDKSRSLFMLHRRCPSARIIVSSLAVTRVASSLSCCICCFLVHSTLAHVQMESEKEAKVLEATILKLCRSV